MALGDHPGDYLYGDVEQLRAKQSESLQALSVKLNDQLALLPSVQKHVENHQDTEDAAAVEVLECDISFIAFRQNYLYRRLLDNRAPTPLPESEHGERGNDAESLVIVDGAELSRVHATLVERMQRQVSSAFCYFHIVFSSDARGKIAPTERSRSTMVGTQIRR